MILSLPLNFIIMGPGGFLLLIITAGLGMYAHYRISSAYNKYSKIKTKSGITGREAAGYILKKAGIYDVEVVSVNGHLSDFYDPINKQLALSQENFSGNSLAAVGVAAHETGHAIQHKVGYKALQMRMTLIPITNISSKVLPFVIMTGFILGKMGGIFIDIGIICYAILTFFHLVTLPVEFDASRRARIELMDLGIIDNMESVGVVKTLNAAGFTYVASFVSSLLNLIYLIMLRRD